MRAAVADIRNDCEFQDNNIVQAHPVIFNFFFRSLRTEGRSTAAESTLSVPLR
jgi:hypothetical protein